MLTSPVTIVAAALRIGDLILTVPRPGRHHTIFHAADAAGMPQPGAEQGFLTSDGQFVDRKTACGIAGRADQILEHKTGGPDELYSEDMW